MILNVLIVIITVVGLWFGGTWIVSAAARIARRFGLSELVIGLTIVAIGTSAPEFAVTIVAALEGKADISVGNVVGSNIFNLGFILGGVALVSSIPTTRKLVLRDGGILIGATVLLLIFLSDLRMDWWEGGLLLLALVAYVGYLLYVRDPDGISEEVPAGEFRWLDVPILIAGIAVIVTSGHFLVEAASEIARHFGLSDWVIGVTIVAAGTSAPELATSLVGVLRGRHGISIGNLIGSDIFNLLGVLGLAAFIHPMTVDQGAYSSLWLLSALVVGVAILMRTGWRLSRFEGGLLVAVNLVRWWADFSL
ncbi:MAG: sodium:calcium antiporter [Candidatus Promineifilaceae bacterium]|nr:sodium:calcium antiporter [Candidatus Promineifilaceae bacterium]